MPALPFDAPAAVVVTGGSSGIGKSFIEHIGKLHPGIMFCNLSRREPPGEKSLGSGELKLRHVACNLADRDAIPAAAARILAHLQEAAPKGPVVLINNAGFGAYGAFPQPGAEELLTLVDVNVRAVLDLTARLLPLLRARGGAIVNVASTAGFQPTAFLATYGASKAFLLHWSLALGEEVRSSGVHVLTVCPGPTRTDFFRRAGVDVGGAGQASADVVAEAWQALRAGRRLVVTGVRNRWLARITSITPRTWSARIGARVLARVRARTAPPSP